MLYLNVDAAIVECSTTVCKKVVDVAQFAVGVAVNVANLMLPTLEWSWFVP